MCLLYHHMKVTSYRSEIGFPDDFPLGQHYDNLHLGASLIAIPDGSCGSCSGGVVVVHQAS